MVLSKAMLSNLGLPQERQLATDWLQKLSTDCWAGVPELQQRNVYAYLLLLCLQDGQLRPPFDAEPPAAPLTTLEHLMVMTATAAWGVRQAGRPAAARPCPPGLPTPASTGADARDPGEGYEDRGGDADEDNEYVGQDSTRQEDSRRGPAYEYSPDGGEFFAAQPVPRCGAFCYLAVVARQNQ
ncbi:hypothetical protein ONE63_007952 [Megalurothrips usitatus]|uniref:DUF4485 domain-containing protein n=1 Tax=Megalurothrips usitatus TaxID=439358 RepID=A0AAV7XU72_9NEOP|nr:hypothetical protein ONE63_007952 [Megalurothrips usitatus]